MVYQVNQTELGVNQVLQLIEVTLGEGIIEFLYVIKYKFFTPTLSEFKILNYAAILIQN